MQVMIGSARIDENGRASGGKAGDQTGKEVATQKWYLHKKGWYVLRAKDSAAREKIARCMEDACANARIGYDQKQRNSLYGAAKAVGFDLTKIDTNVETDCSALVRVCCAAAGIELPDFNTENEKSVLTASGAFDAYADDTHCTKSDYLLRGDILVTRGKGHTAVVLTGSARRVLVRGTSVNLREGNGTQYGILRTAKKGESLLYVATAENGWHAVEADGRVAWISGKFGEVLA